MRITLALLFSAFLGCGMTGVAPGPDASMSADASGSADGPPVGSCSPACSGLTPFCNATKHCVGCTEDGQCAVGSYCKITSDAIASCTPGCSGDVRCANGQKCCDMRCVDTMVDVKNCGGCAMACMAVHSAASCAGGMCMAGKCDVGWGDCDKDGMNGCEANLHADPANCTGCGMACNIPNAFTGCADGCYATACKFGFDDCNLNAMDGCETSVLSDIKNCGGCGKSCANLANATAGCVNGSCVLSMCTVGYADCDQNAGTGCEVKVATDAKNCGKCGNVCPNGLICTNGGCTCPQCNFPNATSLCVNNVCMIDKCVAGYGNCDGNNVNGCETFTDGDNNNCGACGVVCPMQTPYCGMGVCGVIQRTIPNFMGQLGPDYSAQGWIQCVGYLDKLNVDDIPNMNWATPCIGMNYNKIRLACGATQMNVRYIDVKRNVFATKLNAYPEVGLIEAANWNFVGNDIYASGNQPNTGTSWWVNGNGCNEASGSITINNGCTWDAANCFGQNIAGERYLFVYVHN